MNQEFIKSIFHNADGYIELREIRSNNTKQRFFADPDEVIRYQAEKLKNVFLTNIYYGVFTREYKKGTADSCKTTGALWADYDGMKKSEVIQAIKAKGLPFPSAIISTGNGFHCYWLLKERITPRVAMPIIKAIARETGADPKATDQARILRLPGTKNSKDTNNIKDCKIEHFSETRYQQEDFRSILSEETKKAEPEVSLEKAVSPGETGRACINAIMNGVKAGNRNFALGRLTKYLQVTKGSTREQAWQYIREWNKRNDPPELVGKLKTEFMGYWKGEYNLLGCFVKEPQTEKQKLYNTYLAEFCNRKECKRTESGLLALNNIVKANNILFTGYRSRIMTGYEVIIYGLLLIHSEGLSRDQLSKYKKDCMTDKVMNRAVDRLRAKKLIEVKELPGARNKNNYYAMAKKQGTFGLGYTQISNGAIMLAVNGVISPALFKLYVLLLKHQYGKGTCFPGIETLGEKMGVDKTVISKHLKLLEEANFIKRFYEEESGNIKLKYELLI